MKSLGAILLSALAVSASAEAILDCRTALSTEDTNQCASIHLDLAEQQMTQYLDASKQRFADNSVVLASIDSSHEHWLAYRREHCDVVFDIWSGTLSESMALNCETQMTQERTHHLWRTYIASYSNGPSLPEPELD